MEESQLLSSVYFDSRSLVELVETKMKLRGDEMWCRNVQIEKGDHGDPGHRGTHCCAVGKVQMLLAIRSVSAEKKGRV